MKEAHIQLDNTVNAKYAIMPGDPARIDRIIPYLENVQELAYNREFRSIRGEYKGVPIIAISTGVGGSSCSLAVEELRHIGVECMIRIGSCGALQKYIQLGDMVFGSGAVRDDGASRTYVDLRYPAVPDTELLTLLIEVAKENNWNHHVGIIHSHETFYHDSNAEEEKYWSSLGVLGSDFESAALFTIGRIRGAKTASILNNVVLYGQDTSESIGDYVDGENLSAIGEKREIETALEALYRYDLRHRQ